MKIHTLISVGVLAAVLAGCGSDGVKLSPTVIDNSTSGPGAGNGGGNGGGNDDTANQCAYIEQDSARTYGIPYGANCEYPSSFIGADNPLASGKLIVPALPGNGVHVFHDSIFIGENVTPTDAQAGKAVPQEGEGAIFEIKAGAKIALSGEDYILINRGSQIIAEGTASAPIIFSGTKDLIDGTATEDDRGLWGGLQINGNGLTNKCADANNCHVEAEGKPSNYGGNNNAESSGTLRYVQVRHAGYEVVDGDELNGITFNAVGSGTTVEYVQTYTTLDDGFEMFGGAVNLKNVVAVNVGDDSYDFSEGWQGNIQFAIAVHGPNANTCIEADNNGSNHSALPFTKGRVSNLTCVTSGTDSADIGKGSSEGFLFRVGTFFELYNSVVTSNAAGMSSNECMEVLSSVTANSLDQGWSVAQGNVIACTEPFKGDADNPVADLETWWVNQGNAVVDIANLPANIIDGLDTNPRAYIALDSMTDASSAPLTVMLYDPSQLEDIFAPNAVPAEGASGVSSFFEKADFIGAVDPNGVDWTQGWTIGLN